MQLRLKLYGSYVTPMRYVIPFLAAIGDVELEELIFEAVVF